MTPAINDEELVALTVPSLNPASPTATEPASRGLWNEFWSSASIIFQNRFTWLFVLGPVAVLCHGIIGEALCFALAGIALIPCAERLSFITEQVAEHTNGTIGALLNCTFGNAPELLIAVAALRSGYYRVVQLAMLGSIMTNLMLVFGVSCLVGGLRWHVQELRTTSGNVNVVMLLVATAGSLFPAALVLTGQLMDPGNGDNLSRLPSEQEVTFSRVNSAVMLFLYICYLIFQLGTHKDEFDDEPHRYSSAARARRNLFCWRYMLGAKRLFLTSTTNTSFDEPGTTKLRSSQVLHRAAESSASTIDYSDIAAVADDEESPFKESERDKRWRRRRSHSVGKSFDTSPVRAKSPLVVMSLDKEEKNSLEHSNYSDDDSDKQTYHAQHTRALISMRVGVIWLSIITLSVSAITDVLVDTIDGFAHRMRISQVFTSMVIIPFFSNVAEQVSAFIFAYKNEMDLCVGVTVGSAIQIAMFVMPGSVLIGMVMNRSMTLFFHGYETVSLFFGVVMVGAILQGGTTNWLVGASLVSVYIILAAGIWFHELEVLTVDAERLIGNTTQSNL